MITTRFAPSPAGDLHVGSARTALYSYLYAKHHQGKFILRIEDTDIERSTQAAVDVILEGLSWLGINWDAPPMYQSERIARYQTMVQQLLDTGQAYRCYLSKTELDLMRETQIKNKPIPSKSFFKAIYIGKNALDISKNIAINPTLMPDSFNAFVPPGLLSPTSLMSFFEKT